MHGVSRHTDLLAGLPPEVASILADDATMRSQHAATARSAADAFDQVVRHLRPSGPVLNATSLLDAALSSAREGATIVRRMATDHTVPAVARGELASTLKAVGALVDEIALVAPEVHPSQSIMDVTGVANAISGALRIVPASHHEVRTSLVHASVELSRAERARDVGLLAPVARHIGDALGRLMDDAGPRPWSYQLSDLGEQLRTAQQDLTHITPQPALVLDTEAARRIASRAAASAREAADLMEVGSVLHAADALVDRITELVRSTPSHAVAAAEPAVVAATAPATVAEHAVSGALGAVEGALGAMARSNYTDRAVSIVTAALR